MSNLFDVQYLDKTKELINRRMNQILVTSYLYEVKNAPTGISDYEWDRRAKEKVKYNNIDCFIFGRRSSGSFDIRKLTGEVISHGISYKKLKLVEYRKSLLIEREVRGASSKG